MFLCKNTINRTKASINNHGHFPWKPAFDVCVILCKCVKVSLNRKAHVWFNQRAACNNPGSVGCGRRRMRRRRGGRNRRDARRALRPITAQIIALIFRDISFSLRRPQPPPWTGPRGEPLLMAFGAIWRVTQSRWRHSFLSEHLVWSERQVGHLAAAATLAAAPPGPGRDSTPTP